MAIPRRLPFVAGTAVIFVFIIYQLYQHPALGLNRGPAAVPLYEPPPSGDRFTWSQVPVRYPVPGDLIPLPNGAPKLLPRIQHAFSTESSAERALRIERQQQVKATFERCWTSYRERAWMQDELSPITGGGRSSFGGWAATLVDSLDTLYIMGMTEDLSAAIAAVRDIDFSTSEDSTINIFETTIRYLGGFLSAYDLTGNKILLDKAVEIGEMLYVAFDTPNHMPVCRWDWQKAKAGDSQEASTGTLVSELGSLSLEFTRLSQVTGDMRWYDAIQRISDLFDEQQASTHLPGMWPVVVNPKEKSLTGDSGFTVGGMSDSLYEYFPKEYALLGGLSDQYRKLYEDSMATAIKHAFFRPMTPQNDDIIIPGDVRAESPAGAMLEPKAQHLGCFAGGMLALGGKLFDLPEHIEIGRKITNGCIWAYNAVPHGIMPEVFHLVACESNDNCTWDTNKWTDAVMQRAGAAPSTNVDEIIVNKRLPPGFTDIDDKRYILRPEAIESVFILYRITGDKSFQDAAWNMFSTINSLTQTKFANAALSDITAADSLPPKDDRMESFWMAETLKYFYLIFSEPDLISLDEYVLNTEAHPFKRPF